ACLVSGQITIRCDNNAEVVVGPFAGGEVGRLKVNAATDDLFDSQELTRVCSPAAGEKFCCSGIDIVFQHQCARRVQEEKLNKTGFCYRLITDAENAVVLVSESTLIGGVRAGTKEALF